jgi:general secretion pathway protein G
LSFAFSRERDFCACAYGPALPTISYRNVNGVDVEGKRRRPRGGFTLVEMLISLAVIGVLVAIALPSYQRHQERLRVEQARRDIGMISTRLSLLWEDARSYPSSLAALGPGIPLDPWGRPYQYLNLEDPRSRGQARKDHALVPINTDFDLYSMGPDGRSVPPLTASHSRDDIVRANNGNFVGIAADY